MKRKSTYLFCVVAIAAWLTACNAGDGTKKIPSLTETYSKNDKKPFGAFIAYRQLEEMFYRNTVRIENRNFAGSWKNLDDTAAAYISIARSLFTTTEDVNSIIAYTERGNDAFFSAQEFDENLLHELGCSILKELSFEKYNIQLYQSTGLQVKTGAPTDSSRFRYFYLPFKARFWEYDSSTTRVLGTNEYGYPNFIVVFKGKGRIFLHCDPRAFSNYFLLQKNNYQYFEKALGYLRNYPEHVYWNNYYYKLHSQQQAMNESDDSGEFSSLDEILKHPPLAAAFWLLLVMLLLYIFFGIKRRQRIIEVVKPNENTTVTFTETIGRLYLQKKDNKNIADKMVTYFNEYIRNSYFLNTNIINDDFITTLSRKSGVPREKTESLYRAIGHAHHYAVIDDFQLLSLNEQVQDFFKRAQKQQS